MKRYAALLAVAMVLLSGSAAHAHSALVLTKPAPQSTIPAGVRLVKLGFASPFLYTEGTYEAEVQITNPKNVPVAPICSDAQVKVLQGVFEFRDVGSYTVTWRAISNEGNVIGGSYKFTVDAPAEDVTDPSAACKDAGMVAGQINQSSGQAFYESNLFVNFAYVAGAIAAVVALVGFMNWRRKTKQGKSAERPIP